MIFQLFLFFLYFSSASSINSYNKDISTDCYESEPGQITKLSHLIGVPYFEELNLFLKIPYFPYYCEMTIEVDFDNLIMVVASLTANFYSVSTMQECQDDPARPKIIIDHNLNCISNMEEDPRCSFEKGKETRKVKKLL